MVSVMERREYARSKDPAGFIHIVSKDQGYDPLIEHLCERRIKARRQRDTCPDEEVAVALAPEAREALAREAERAPGLGALGDAQQQPLAGHGLDSHLTAQQRLAEREVHIA